DEAPASLRRLLGRVALEDVEDLARQLVDFKVPLEALGERALLAQEVQAKVLGSELLREVGGLEKSLEGGGDCGRFREQLELLRGIFCALRDGKRPREIGLEGLKKSCTVGKKANLADPVRADKTMRKLLLAASELPTIDVELGGDLAEALGPFVARFRRELLESGLVPMDALIVLARDLLRDHVDVRREEGQRFDQILVDEFQDTDPLQYEIVLFLSEAHGGGEDPRGAARDAFDARLQPGKLFIVGDAKQSIYRFRGADTGAYERAVNAIRREGGQVLTLETNFRSVPELVEPLNALFEPLFSRPRGEGEPRRDPEFSPLSAWRGKCLAPAIEVWSVGDAGAGAVDRRGAEAAAIAGWIGTLLEKGSRRAKDVAILLRSRSSQDIYLGALHRAGIPLVAEGGRGFFARHEVELLLAILGVATRPADPVPLVACLRSAVCAVPDVELHRFALEMRDAPGWSLWRLGANPDPGSYPRLSRALSLLRDFISRHRDEPIDRLARAALDETPLRIVMASSHGGAQRVLNLEKAVRRIEELVGKGGLSTEEVLLRIEEHESSDVAEGDSPIADETLDAVRILTIHAAKGLEWPVVILPDLAREAKGRSEATRVHFLADPEAALAVKAGGLRTPAFLRRAREEERHEAAEGRRLLYVAATRACDTLVLVVGGSARAMSSPWVDALAAWGYWMDGEFPAVDSLVQGAIVHRRLPGPARASGSPGPEAPDPCLARAATELEAVARAVPGTLRRGIRSPSRLGEEVLGLPDAEEVRPRGRSVPRGDRGIARAAGSAVHQVLELWDRSDPRWLFEAAPRAALVAAARLGLDPRPVAARALEILEEARASGRLDAIARLPVVARELPFLLEDKMGDVWEGTIDLVTGSAEAPVVLDFKTDPSAAGDLERTHGAQLAKYAEALKIAAGLPVLPRTRIEPL
ncbi:MAG TPA: 3'-5' exonuclease, partial [Planctomycetota bacterium]|nr:3'-5' exonuclease [Planctomycetota bacterium]